MRYVPLGLILDNTGKVLRIRIGYCDVKALWDNWLFCDNSQSNYTRIPYIDVNPCWMMRNCKFQFSKSLPKVGIDNINTKLIAINDPSDASPRGYVYALLNYEGYVIRQRTTTCTFVQLAGSPEDIYNLDRATGEVVTSGDVLTFDDISSIAKSEYHTAHLDSVVIKDANSRTEFDVTVPEENFSKHPIIMLPDDTPSIMLRLPRPLTGTNTIILPPSSLKIYVRNAMVREHDASVPDTLTTLHCGEICLNRANIELYSLKNFCLVVPKKAGVLFLELNHVTLTSPIVSSCHTAEFSFANVISPTFNITAEYVTLRGGMLRFGTFSIQLVPNSVEDAFLVECTTLSLTNLKVDTGVIAINSAYRTKLQALLSGELSPVCISGVYRRVILELLPDLDGDTSVTLNVKGICEVRGYPNTGRKALKFKGTATELLFIRVGRSSNRVFDLRGMKCGLFLFTLFDLSEMVPFAEEIEDEGHSAALALPACSVLILYITDLPRLKLIRFQKGIEAIQLYDDGRLDFLDVPKYLRMGQNIVLEGDTHGIALFKDCLTNYMAHRVQSLGGLTEELGYL